MDWTADCTNASPQFVRLSLQSWVPQYLWEHVNPSLASLGQIMSIKKNQSKINEVASRPQYNYVKDSLLKMLKFSSSPRSASKKWENLCCLMIQWKRREFMSEWVYEWMSDSLHSETVRECLIMRVCENCCIRVLEILKENECIVT